MACGFERVIWIHLCPVAVKRALPNQCLEIVLASLLGGGGFKG